MNSKWQITLSVVVIMMVLTACGSPSTNGDNSSQPVIGTALPTEIAGSMPQQLSIDPGWTSRGEAAVWPEYIPEDIPVLEGKIRKVMVAPESHIRIFYEGISKDQIDQYLRLLERKGFQLEYQVYIQEGFPDNSEERMRKGDYDAIDITKGDYHMNLGYGEGNISYDIYTSGFSMPIPTPAGLDWPADLVNVVPKPERCIIEMAAPDGKGGYQITCRLADQKVGSDYLEVLQTAGFLPKPSSSIVSASGVYGKDDLEIIVEQHSTALVLISIMRIDLSKTSWPAELMAIVPQPENCLILNVLKLEGLNFMISCQGESDQVVADYIEILKADGFVETGRMTAASGEPVSVSFEGKSLEVQLLIGTQDPLRNLTIKVAEMP